MHVLICSYEFDLGSEGICTGRLVRALLNAGCNVTLVTSPEARISFTHEHLRYHLVSAQPKRPAKLFFRIALLLGHLQTRFGYVWSRRVAALNLPQRPDVIYGRAHPFQSVAGAHGLASRRRVPLWAHLSDPTPSPFWENNHPEYKPALRSVRRLLRESQALTFTTQEAIAFEESLVGQFNGKAFVLNHVAPEPALIPRGGKQGGKVFAYFGSFYGKRNALPLLEGFREHLRNNTHDRLLFVGTDRTAVEPHAQQLGIGSAISVMARVDNVREVMERVEVLVATDSFSSAPVFLSTKLVEYLVVNRPVLLLSPRQSPGAKLIANFPQTATLVTSEQNEAVGAGFARSASCVADDEAYQKRFANMSAFAANTVAERFMTEVSNQNRRFAQ